MNKLTTKQILGVIDATTYIESLKPVIHNRSVASLPFAGRYRLIDFMLSNMVHAGIDSVGIVSHAQQNSLKEHIGSGKVWDLDRKNGGLFFFAKRENEPFGSKDGIQRIMDFFLRTPHKYVVVAKSNIIGRLPLLDVLKRHKKNTADITELTHEGKELGVFIFEKEMIFRIFEEYKHASQETIFDFIAENVTSITKDYYEVDEKIMVIDSLESYYEDSMSLLDLDTWKQVFPKQYPILTKAKDEPPTKYLQGSHVTNTIIANGCVLKGEVENSILSRSVKVGENTIIRNSIIMPKVEIGDNCVLDGVIIDKNVTISDGTNLVGTNKSPVVVPKGATIQGELISQ